jgi:hypothetical protein
VNAILRTLIVWLALLAVPFQGFASAAMLPCAPQAHQGHHAAHTSMHHDQAPPHHCDADKHAPHDAKHGNCGACCAGVAIAPPLMALPSAGASTTFAVVLEAGHVPTVHLDHPERPPRFARA